MRKMVLGSGRGGWNAQTFAMRGANILEGAIRVTFAHDGHAAWRESRYARFVDVDASKRKMADDTVEEDEGGRFAFRAMFWMWGRFKEGEELNDMSDQQRAGDGSIIRTRAASASERSIHREFHDDSSAA
jgi:hypothetical protein